MTTSEIETSTYECQNETADPISGRRCPKLFWAAAATFSANLLIAAGFFLSPELRVTMYGEEPDQHRTWTVKPSPFTEVIDPKPVKKVRRAERITPVVSPATEPSAFFDGSEFPRMSAAAQAVGQREETSSRLRN